MKFRIYYEEFTDQAEAFFMFQAIDAGGEYQVPQAKPGTPPEERVHTVSQDFTVASTLTAALPDAATSSSKLGIQVENTPVVASTCSPPSSPSSTPQLDVPWTYPTSLLSLIHI